MFAEMTIESVKDLAYKHATQDPQIKLKFEYSLVKRVLVEHLHLAPEF